MKITSGPQWQTESSKNTCSYSCIVNQHSIRPKNTQGNHQHDVFFEKKNRLLVISGDSLVLFFQKIVKTFGTINVGTPCHKWWCSIQNIWPENWDNHRKVAKDALDSSNTSSWISSAGSENVRIFSGMYMLFLKKMYTSHVKHIKSYIVYMSIN